MIWNLVGKAASLFFAFMREGEFVIPDSGSIKLTIRDNAGAVITGYDALAQADCLVSTLVVVVPAELNTLVGAFETRFVRLDFTSGGEPLFAEKAYRVSSFVPLTATPEDVRSVFGARAGELPDADIDLREAYFTLLEEYPTEMAGAITGASTSRSANRLTVLRTAWFLLPSMPNRVLKEDSMNTATQIRDSADWERIGVQIQTEMELMISTLRSAASVAGSNSPTSILLMSAPSVDPITNA